MAYGAAGGLARRQVDNSSSTTSGSLYCNVTLSYSHADLNDTVNVRFAFPAPSDFQSRWFVSGGGGFSLNSDATGGLSFGAASGATDAGYDGFAYSYDEKVLIANGTLNWQATNMFGYQALGELTQIGRYMTKQLYNVTTIKSYFSGCSDGGREAMSQAQRWPDLYDGIAAGAPAFHFSQQQILHLFPGVVETVQGHAPNPCALEAIVNATIAACDELDGVKDGVVARTDLCKLQFNLTSIVGTQYNCSSQTLSHVTGEAPSTGVASSNNSLSSAISISSATNTVSLGTPTTSVNSTGITASTSARPTTTSGIVSTSDVQVAQAIYDGVFNSANEQAYLSWQYTASLSDAQTTYNASTATYDVAINSMGGEFVRKFIQLIDQDTLPTIANVTYDTLVSWMATGIRRYNDSLQTTYVDLSTYKQHGGKLLHYHGESDPFIPAGSSVHYRQSVSSAMNANDSALDDWYQLYLVPGAGHCGTNSLQPNGPYPEASSLVNQLIDWVENGVVPSGLNATAGNTTQQLCRWPTRPLYSNATTSSGAAFTCVDQDAESLGSWTYSFDAAFGGQLVD
jgi:tannase